MDFKQYDERQAKSIGNQSSAVTGPMVANIEMCKAYTQNGKAIVEFTLQPADGRKPLRFVKLFLNKQDGSAGYGGAQWNAIRALLRLTSEESLKMEQIQEDMQGVMTTVTYLRGVEGKTLGFLMQRNNWALDEEGKYYKYSMNIVLPYDPNTKQTFTEKDAGQEAIVMEKRAATLKDRTAEGIGTPSSYTQTSTTPVNDLPSY